MPRVLRLLAIASAPFLLESAFEMYVLTLVNGPQNLFFSIAHLWPIAMVIIAISGLSSLCLLTLMLATTLGPAVRSVRGGERFPLARVVVTTLLGVHLVLLATYGVWAR